MDKKYTLTITKKTGSFNQRCFGRILPHTHESMGRFGGFISHERH